MCQTGGEGAGTSRKERHPPKRDSERRLNLPMAVFTAPASIKVPTKTTKPWNTMRSMSGRPYSSQSADQIVEEVLAHPIRNDHHREEGNERGEEHAVDEDDQSGLLQMGSLGCWISR